MFFCDAESHKERDDGAYLLKKHLSVSDIYKVTSLIPPLSKRCQDPRRLRVVGTYLRGEEGKENFLQRQEGCQGLSEDRRGNQSSQGKLTKLVSNTKKLFIYTLFLRATYIYIYFFFRPEAMPRLSKVDSQRGIPCLLYTSDAADE